MKKMILGTIFCSLLAITSFAQNKNSEKGKYIATTRNEKFKFNLLEGNKFELVMIYGDYQKKGDSLYFGNQIKNKSNFLLTASNSTSNIQENVIKVKIKKDQILYYFSNIYIGTQEGKLPVQYKRLEELAKDIDSSEANEFTIEIPRSKFIYLVYENYSGKSEHTKYALPKNVKEIDLNFTYNNLSDIQLKGYLNKDTNELVVSDLASREPITFKLENILERSVENEIQPLESKSEKNWTYEGKESYIATPSEVVVDSAVAVVDSAAVAYPETSAAYESIKIPTSKNLTKSLKDVSKNKNQFLVIIYDPKNNNLDKEFDSFINDQQSDIYYYSLSEAKYKDSYPFSYVIASQKDKKWFDKYKVNENPVIVITDYKGNVLTKIIGSIHDKGYLFSSYTSLKKDLNEYLVYKETNSILNNLNSSPEILLKAFKKIETLEYEYPEKKREIPSGSVVDNDSVDYSVPEIKMDYDLPIIKWNEKIVGMNWRKVIESYSKNSNPNFDLVNLIGREISNKGFTNQIFKKEKSLNETDYLSIDYILKRYNSLKEKTFVLVNPSLYSFEAPVKVDKILSDAISTNVYYSETSSQKKNDLNILSKVLYLENYENIDVVQNYFTLINSLAETDDLENEYVNDFETFFNIHFGNSKNSIESLDKLYSVNQNLGWIDFKNSISNMINNVAWFVVKKSVNSESIQKAINWSETSLIMQKNNAYYLDTLAQLYYKNSEKTKALKTQELAVKYSDMVEDQTIKNEIKETLKKMKSGKL